MAADTVRYVRYADDGETHYGIEDGDRIRQLAAAPWLGGEPTGNDVAKDGVTLVAPAEPSKVIAVGIQLHQPPRGDDARGTTPDP